MLASPSSVLWWTYTFEYDFLAIAIYNVGAADT
jgi:hypothetical protein